MNDEELLRAWEGLTLPPERFGHREHVRVAWICLRREEPAAGIARFVRGLRAFAAAAGAPDKFHETVTWAFLLLVLDRMGRGGDSTDGWETFIAANPDLLDRRVLETWYRPETLSSPVARRHFVMPDRVV